MRRHDPLDPISTDRKALFAVLLIGALLIPSLAFAEQSGIYVVTHITPETTANMAGAQHAMAFVYTAKGMKIASGKGAGGWLPGEEIALEPGEYWVGIGQSESVSNLHHYTVSEGAMTVVETGWVSLATLPLAEQPKTDCAQWTATLRAYLLVDGKKEAIIDNSNRKTNEYGTLQLHPGQYLIEFNRLTTTVTVEAGKDYRIPTGYVGPTFNKDAYLLRNKGDEPQQSGLPVCSDGAIHVPAGDYFLRELIVRNDGADVDTLIDPVTVVAEGNQGYSSLKSDGPSHPKPADSSDGQAITTEQIKGLTDWARSRANLTISTCSATLSESRRPWGCDLGLICLPHRNISPTPV